MSLIVLLSPAKTLDFEPVNVDLPLSKPRLLQQTFKLVDRLKKKKVNDLKKLMSVSANIAELNVARYAKFSEDFNDDNSKVAILAFKGDVYLGLEALKFDEADSLFGMQVLRILSGLYGLLRPYDLIQPYRLEMGTRLKIRRADNLYQFWGDTITDLLNDDIKASNANMVINLASKEYFKAINTKKISSPILNIDFREMRNGELKFVSFNAKKARGYMSKFIVNNKISDYNNIKGFDLEGYTYDDMHSTNNNWMFIRHQ